MGELVLLGCNTCTILWLATVEFLTVVRASIGVRLAIGTGGVSERSAIPFLTTPADRLGEVSEVEATVTFEADIRLAF